MIKTFKLTLAIVAFALLWCIPLQADEHESKESIGTGVLITPKEGHEEALIKAITDYHLWVANFEGHMRFNWYSILTGPDTGKYIAYSGGHSWADFDAEYDWQKEAGEVFEQNVAPHIESMERWMSSEMTEMSHWPDSWEGYTMFTIEHWYVKNGHYGPFRQGLKRIVETLKAGGYTGYWGFSSNASGGYGNQITIISPKKGWSDMAEKDPSFYDIMSKELGGEDQFQEFMSNWASTFKTGKNYTLKYLAGASDYGDE
jgi:hypothetical protein